MRFFVSFLKKEIGNYMRMRRIKNLDNILNECLFYYEDNFNNNEIHLEIGMGKASFIINMAKENPNINYIGIEKNKSVLGIAIKNISKENLSNIKVLNGDIINFIDLLKARISRIYLNFSDPWPKERHEKRRLTHINFLRDYDKLFKSTKEIVLKTDNDLFFSYSKESLLNYGYEIVDESLDLTNSNIPSIKTEYEKRFINRGIKIKYLRCIKK